MTRKTYYTVQYAKMGASGPQTACFDSRDAAYDFYNSREYVDKPQAHTVSKPETIEKYEFLVNSTAWEIGGER